MKPHSITTASFSLRLKFLFPTAQTIQTPIPTGTKPASSTVHSVIALAFLASITAAFFIGFFFLYIRRCSQSRTRRLERRITPPPQPRAQSKGLLGQGADASVVRSLPLLGYDDGMISEKAGPLDCVVCLCEFEQKEIVKKIPYCGHVFHPECIEMWLFSHSSCPLCRSTQLLLPLDCEEIEGSEGRLSGESRETCVERERR